MILFSELLEEIRLRRDLARPALLELEWKRRAGWLSTHLPEGAFAVPAFQLASSEGDGLVGARWFTRGSGEVYNVLAAKAKHIPILQQRGLNQPVFDR
jgi:hypothetical protein